MNLRCLCRIFFIARTQPEACFSSIWWETKSSLAKAPTRVQAKFAAFLIRFWWDLPQSSCDDRQCMWRFCPVPEVEPGSTFWCGCPSCVSAIWHHNKLHKPSQRRIWCEPLMRGCLSSSPSNNSRETQLFCPPHVGPSEGLPGVEPRWAGSNY